MFFFNKFFHRGATSPNAVRLNGFVDYHSHILPGVDDGVKTLQESLAILGEYENMGFSEVWFTPHIMEDLPNTTESLKERFHELSEAYKGSIKLNLASENMLDELFIERLEAGDLLPMKDKLLLVETSYYNPPMGLIEILEKIFEKGFTPILAHPERYVYMMASQYENFINKGILMQLNILSLKGFYGKLAQTKAFVLAEHGGYNFAGTDIHHISQIGHLKSLLTSDHAFNLIKGISENRLLHHKQ